jgi:16S rRNA (cytosine967-C5)-methyltransferase
VISGTVHELDSGDLQIQDEGSQLIALLAGRGSRILDCCAAPGGKTRILASLNPQSKIIALDIHSRRARLLAQRVAAPNLAVIAADARSLPLSADFDCILADVPCSGTGTLARNPEIKWRLLPSDLDDLQQRQTAILGAALKRLAPGGRTLYATCSLESEENEAVVETCLREYPQYRLVEMRPALEKLRAEGELIWPDLESLLSGPYLRTLPGVHPCDGFFAAMIVLPA